MESLIGFLLLVGLLVVLISFIVFMFSVHWSLGVIAILLVLGKVI